VTSRLLAALSRSIDRDRIKVSRTGAFAVVVVENPAGVAAPDAEQALATKRDPVLRGTLLFLRREGVWRTDARPVTDRRQGDRLRYLGPPQLRLTSVAPADRPPADVAEPSLLALHVVGEPVPTSAGWLLRVRTGHGASVGASSYGEVEQRSKTRTATADERLLSAADLALRDTDVVILQAPPDEVAARSLGTQREGTHALARDCIAAGAKAVLVLPSLVDADAARVGGLLAAWADGPRRMRLRRPADVLRLHVRLLEFVDGASKYVVGDDPVADVVTFVRMYG
jgi:hypothetical protein